MSKGAICPDKNAKNISGVSLNQINIFLCAFVSLYLVSFLIYLRYYFDQDKNIINMRKKVDFIYLFKTHSLNI